MTSICRSRSSSYTPHPSSPNHHRPFQPHRRLSLSVLHLYVVFASSAILAVVHCHRYNVGDLRCWGPPSPSNPHVYSTWSQNHRFQIGDSLMFLYPPSEDSVVQLSESAFNACDLSNPILKIDDGNSVFNLTSAGVFYFASGRKGHCANHQRLPVNVLLANGSSADAETAAPAASPSSSPASFPMVFGPSSSPSASVRRASVAVGSWILTCLMMMMAVVFCSTSSSFNFSSF